VRRLRALIPVLLLASACGAPASTPLAAPTGTAATTGTAERLVIESDLATDVVETATGRRVATLPGGVLSPAKDLVVHLNAGSGKTAVAGVDLAGGSLFALGLSGDYAFPNAYGAAPSGFSPNGQWLVLVSRDANESRFAVIDVAHGAVANTVTLGSRFTFDAIHNDGSAMYVIEHPRPGSTAYNVRFYDLRAKTLSADIIFDKGAISQYDPTIGLMDGTFHVSVAPTKGDWSFGLYMRPNGSPFVHALNVPGHYATCIIDLAGTWAPSSMFSMALSDDGRALYVVDPTSGTISVVDALAQKVSRKATFATRGAGDPHAASAVVSRDGTRLYASAARGIAIVQTADLSLKGWAAPDLAVRSLAVSSDGARLFALTGDTVQVIDAASGRVLSQLVTVSGARAIRLLARDAAAARP
jgi:DNA-binding beta-propeller fold protein YncE